MSLKDVEKFVHSIKAGSIKFKNDLMSGNKISRIKGTGLQFKEHQLYQHGDEVRFIDWKLLARKRKPYIKTFEEEKNNNLPIIFSLSPNLLLGRHEILRIEMALDFIYFMILYFDLTKDTVNILIPYNDKVQTLEKISGKKGLGLFQNLLKKIGVLNDEYKISKSFGESPVTGIESHQHLLSRVPRKTLWIVDEMNFEKNKTSLNQSKIIPVILEASFPKRSFFLSTLREKSQFSSGFYYSDQILKKDQEFKKNIIECKPKYLEDFYRSLLRG